MKKILGLWAILTVAVAFVGCDKTKPIVTDPEMYAWHLTTWEVGGGSAAAMPKEINLKFTDKGTFYLWQDIDGKLEFFTGGYTFTGGTLSGSYSDGQAWAYSYTVTDLSNLITDAAREEKLILTAVEDATYKATFETRILGEILAGQIPSDPTRTSGQRFL